MSKYVYFVSFSHDRGFGNLEVKLSQQIQSYEDMKLIQKNAEENSQFRQIHVLHYQLMRVE